MKTLLYTLACVCLIANLHPAAGAVATNTAKHLTLDESLAIALQQNPAILQAQQEIKASHGLIVEVRAAALPQVRANGQYERIDKNAVESFGGGSVKDNQYQPWGANIEITQLVYSGGRVNAALRAAKLTDQIALISFQRAIADVVLSVRRTFYQTLLSQAQVFVREQSVKLLERQLQDTKLRLEAGTVPQFNVLRAEVELANARPPLIRAQNNLRLSRETLVRLLALDTPGTQEFTGITFAGRLAYEPRRWELPAALSQALASRPELQLAERQLGLARENANVATAGNKPEFYVFGNYGIRDRTFGNDLDDTIHGWTVGARVTWPIFDGLATRGRVQQARAQQEQAAIGVADTRRGIELEVRQAYSDYKQALELLEAQKKTVEQAEESLRLAESRFKAGSGTQLDVLSAQTALTEARSNEVQALYEYNVALAILDRVTGAQVNFAK